MGFYEGGVSDSCLIIPHHRSNMVSAEAARALFPLWFPSLLRGARSQQPPELKSAAARPRHGGEIPLTKRRCQPAGQGFLWPVTLKERVRSPCMQFPKEKLHLFELKYSISFSCLLAGPFPVCFVSKSFSEDSEDFA